MPVDVSISSDDGAKEADEKARQITDPALANAAALLQQNEPGCRIPASLPDVIAVIDDAGIGIPVKSQCESMSGYRTSEPGGHLPEMMPDAVPPPLAQVSAYGGGD